MMENRARKYALIFFLHITILVIYLYGNAVMHEQFHKANGYNFGCLNGSISINWKGGQFTCYSYSEFQTEDQRLYMNMLDSQNEIASYNLNTIAMFIDLLSMICFILWIEFRSDEDG